VNLRVHFQTVQIFKAAGLLEGEVKLNCTNDESSMGARQLIAR